MRFGTTLLATIIGVIGIVVLLTAGVSNTVLERDARARLDGDLEHVLTAFDDVRELGESLLRVRAHAVAEEPRLKAVVASVDVDHATLLDVSREMQETLELDIFVVTDAAGKLRVDPGAPAAAGELLTSLPGFAEALRAGTATALWVRDGQPFEVAVQRIAFGEDVVGYVAIGERVVDTVPATIHRQTGATVMLMLDGKLVASGPEALDPALVELSAAAVRNGATTTEGQVGRAHHLLRVGPYAAGLDAKELRIVAAVSLDEALAASREMSRLLLGVSGVALALAFVSAWAVARRLARPVRALADHTREIASGLLRTRPEVRGPVELVELGRAMNAMTTELADSRAQLAAKARLEQELEIAARIQTSILPATPRVRGLEMAMAMVPATEVGGDYYDVIPCDDGCWIAIGDVAGHGLQAGLVMMMLQSALGVLGPMHPEATPATLTCGVNRLLHQNIRERLRQDEHVTFTLFRYREDGTMTFAGAHEDILVLRPGAAHCEVVETRGTWLGITPDVSRAMVDDTLKLGDNDIVVLYTDGITEALDAEGRQFGLERLCAVVEQARARGATGIRDRVLAEIRAWAPHPHDDLTLVVLHRLAGRGGTA